MKSTGFWQANREAALQALAAFVERAGQAYADGRFYDLDWSNDQTDLDVQDKAVSGLSPWLRRRVLCEAEVIEAVCQRHEDESCRSFLSEVYWRTYFKGHMEHKPYLWFDYGDQVENGQQELSQDPDLKRAYEQACRGETGIDCFDHWVRQLKATAYLHNHARMWFASIWIFTLKLPWALGADFFLRHLLDGDPASNTLSWRWVAGLHTKGKAYVARAENIQTFTQGRFFPKGQLNEQAEALSEKDLDKIHGSTKPLTFDAEPQPGAEFTLLLTNEDCHVESWPLQGKPRAIMGLIDRQAGQVSEIVADFDMACLDDALQRACNHYQVPAALLSGQNWAQGLIRWAQEQEVKTLVTPYCPLGYVAESLASVEPALEEAGLALYEVPRPYDRDLWPHTRKGYFAFKKHVFAA